jgi:hypothetical protein
MQESGLKIPLIARHVGLASHKLLGTDGPQMGGSSRITFENHQWRTNDGRGDNRL